ncbi:MAG: acetyl-CoA carboxylase biotin carboxyl carrier protein subunit [Verrucomicrobia bacterium]|nr:acetyl-CoA carboxylase biotin carboxyl carrier protein subunit [Verrucomicrobiota bacterium]
MTVRLHLLWSRRLPSGCRRCGAAPAPAAAAKSPAAAGAGDVTSPLAGKVVSIDAPVGTAVKAGDKVITLEAMKMNTVVSASSDGTVKAILVNPGDSVEEGQPLLTIG